MAVLNLKDMIKSFDGSGDVTVWLKKIKLVAKMQKIEDLASLIPLYLDGPAFAIFEQMEEGDKDNEESIEAALLSAFSMNCFQAWDALRQ